MSTAEAADQPERLDEPPLDIVRNDDRSRFEGYLDEVLVAAVDFIPVGDVQIITHTLTAPAWRGRHIAARMTRFALDDARQRGKKVRPDCPYTADFVSRHPDYRDLLAQPS